VQSIAQEWKRGYISWDEKEREQGFLLVGVSEIVGCAIEQFSPTLEFQKDAHEPFERCLNSLNSRYTVDSESLEFMSTTEQSDALDQSSLPLTEQVVRLQALLEASRAVHSTIELTDVLQQSARIAVRELELEGALFTQQDVVYGNVPAEAVAGPCEGCPRFELLSRDGKVLSELVVATPDRRPLLRTQSTINVIWSMPVWPRISTRLAPFSKAFFRRPCHRSPATRWQRAREPVITLAETTWTW
jgi:hypothetical protein